MCTSLMNGVSPVAHSYCRDFDGAPPVGPSSPPVLESDTFAATTENAKELSVPVPVGLSAGDLWIIPIGTDSAENITTPLNWSRGAETDDGSGEQPSGVVFYKTALASESPVLIEWGTIEQAIAKSIRVSGGVFDNSTVNNVSTNSASLVSPAAAAAEDNSLVMQFGIGDDNNPGTINWDGGVPSGDSIGVLNRSAASGGVFIGGVENDQATAGAASVGSWTYGAGATRPITTFTVVISPTP